ncbi:acetoin operon expression regulatory protein [Bacillus freudenreichii]|nr:acetoin operon expression regulatory protein [Bacillus freudenreichii]
MQQIGEKKRMITFSWRRCYEFGLSPTQFQLSKILNDRQIDQLLKKNADLTNVAIPLINNLSPLLTQPGHLASLADRNGTIIYTKGDTAFEKSAKKLQMQVGANWLEKERGTNAIGVALREKNSICIYGDQHFYVNAHYLSCSAAPIFSPSGEVIGVINISGEKDLFHPHNHVLAQLIADSIHHQLVLRHVEDEKKLAEKEIDYITNKLITVPYLSLNAKHHIIRANDAARRELGKNLTGEKLKDKHYFFIESIPSVNRNLHRFAAFKKTEHSDTRRGLYTFSDIQGVCPSIMQAKKVARKAAVTDIPILIIGETGTGKELFAQSIHTSSLRSPHPFVAVNCSAIPESLIESELFGYVGGSFTGASKEGSMGKFEAAQNGTVFLDEIGDMSLRSQASLLRALQEKEITPVGSTTSKQINVRVVAATNKNLLQEIEAGRFRADLYYRLKGIQITLPPLRKRNDLIDLAYYFLNDNGYQNKTMSKEAEEKILIHDWPGNMRELMNVLFEAAVLSEENTIHAHDLRIDHFPVEDSSEIAPLKDVEKETIKRYVRLANGNMSLAAELLDISRTTLYRKINEYKIELR